MDKVVESHALQVFRSQLSSLAKYMDDPFVQEIMVNAPNDIWVEREGKIEKVTDADLSDFNLRGAVKALAGANKKDMSPVLDCRMTGYRIAAALYPVGIRGNALCIRKHARSNRTLANYMEAGSFEVETESYGERLDNSIKPDLRMVRRGGEEVVEFLKWMVVAKKNIIVAGSTGSGKTTFLNALLAEIPADQRVLTIEDTAELQVKTPNYVSLEVADSEGVTIRGLVRLALRFRPDRIVVGEVRGAEAYDLLDAMNTGHSGGACSLHADNPVLALLRLESMVRMSPDAANLPLDALRAQIASTFQYVVYCSRHQGRRGPEEIIEIKGIKDGSYVTESVFNRKGEVK
jgi:Flp pilus assembly CpaF family ATPase